MAPLLVDRNSEALQQISDLVQSSVKDGGRSIDGMLSLKIGRLTNVNSFGANASHILVFGDATVEHCANPETWLPLLVGGGQYNLRVYHPNRLEHTASIGGDMLFSFEGPPITKMNLQLVDDPSWTGPRLITFPKAAPVQQQYQETAFGASRGLPLGSPTTAPQTQLGLNPGAAAPDYATQIRAELAEVKLGYERQLLEMRSQNERQQLQQDADRKIAALSAEIKQLAHVASQPKGDSGLGAAITQGIGMLASFMQSSQQQATETTKLMMTMQQESQKLMMTMQQASRDSSEKMLIALTQRPAVDPMFKDFLDRAEADRQPVTAIMSQMASGMANMFGVITEVTQQMINITSPPAESTGMQIMKEIGRTVTNIAMAPVQIEQAKIEAQKLKNRSARQLNGPPPPPKGPAQQVVNAEPDIAPSEEYAETEDDTESYADMLEAAIRAKEDPADVAQLLMEAAKDEDFQAEIAAQGEKGIIGIFESRLGNWVADAGNQAYLYKLSAIYQALFEEQQATSAQ